jgi:hypothetical protein
MSPLRETLIATSVAASGRFVNGNDRVSPMLVAVVVVVVCSNGDMRQEGIDEGCSEGTHEDSFTAKECFEMRCSEGIDARSEDGFEGDCRDGIEGGFVDDAFALTTKELRERTRAILAAHDNLMMTDLEESLIVCE